MVSLSSLCWPSLAVLALHPRYCGLALANAAAQLAVFLVTAVVPALGTGRMSYVDIAWPWGLVTLGLLPLLRPPPQWSARTGLVMAAYLLQGGRMALGQYYEDISAFN